MCRGALTCPGREPVLSEADGASGATCTKGYALSSTYAIWCL